MYVKQFFTPQLVETQQSKFSGKVEVFQYLNKFYIRAGEVHQSGGWAGALFHNASLKFKVQSLKLKNILILGLAGGTFVKIITKMYPNIHITAVDIDVVMVDIGRKYFGLNGYKNLKIIIDDAYEYIQKNKEKFDLVFVDIFQGDEMPIKFTSKDFLKNIVGSTSNNGHIIINRLYLSNHKRQTDEFYENLSKWQKELGFKIIDFYQNIGNKVLFLEKQGKI